VPVAFRVRSMIAHSVFLPRVWTRIAIVGTREMGCATRGSLARRVPDARFVAVELDNMDRVSVRPEG
jgi:hypothetical protein